MLPPVVDHILSHAGLYRGHGTNFEGHPFRAQLEIKNIANGSAVELRFRAEDEEQAFHDELTLIATDLLASKIALWSVSTNTPGVLRHELIEDSSDAVRERRLTFRLGDPSDRHHFRQEITLDFLKDGRIEYRYSWGVPGEEFGSRVRTVLERQEA
jgi:uncharacterized protein YndB with AHSA1/START domain